MWVWCPKVWHFKVEGSLEVAQSIPRVLDTGSLPAVIQEVWKGITIGVAQACCKGLDGQCLGHFRSHSLSQLVNSAAVARSITDSV